MTEKIIQVGVTYTGTDEKHGNYEHWLKGNDRVSITVLSPAHTGLENIATFDGIVLSGGIDMHPKFYGNSNTRYPNAPQEFQEGRDAFEIAVYEASRLHNLPLLGVCRGMQLVNCVLGGNMVQDIGATGNAIHRYEQNDKAHGIDIVKGSLLAEITGIGRSVVNSAHHQAVDKLGEGLIANCISDDGIVEGLEWIDPTGKPFFIGVQWHPERMFKLNLAHSPITKNIRDRFIEAIRRKMA